MGFGGGGGTGLTGAHVHSAAAGQGGALSNATLLNAPTLISQIKWDLIETYEAAVAESSHVFSFAAIDFDADSFLVITIDGVATATFILQMRFNTIATANYDTHGSSIIGVVQTFINSVNQTSFELMSSADVIANRLINGMSKIFLEKGSTGLNWPSCINDYGSSPAIHSQGLLTTDTASLTDIEILTSTSTWKIGTRITLYRVNR